MLNANIHMYIYIYICAWMASLVKRNCLHFSNWFLRRTKSNGIPSAEQSEKKCYYNLKNWLVLTKQNSISSYMYTYILYIYMESESIPDWIYTKIWNITFPMHAIVIYTYIYTKEIYIYIHVHSFTLWTLERFT